MHSPPSQFLLVSADIQVMDGSRNGDVPPLCVPFCVTEFFSDQEIRNCIPYPSRTESPQFPGPLSMILMCEALQLEQ